MTFVGIDPGLTGALAVIREKDNATDAQVWSTKTIKRKKGREYDVPWMVRLLNDIKIAGPVARVVIEEQLAFPGPGRQAIKMLGKGEGLWVGLVAGMMLPYELVRPQAWKKLMLEGFDKSDKASSVIRAGRLFPEIELGEKEHGKGDALLICEFGRRVDARG
jgi:crossover junction endodeoxyribonuclease RuvC